MEYTLIQYTIPGEELGWASSYTEWNLYLFCHITLYICTNYVKSLPVLLFFSYCVKIMVVMITIYNLQSVDKFWILFQNKFSNMQRKKGVPRI